MTTTRGTATQTFMVPDLGEGLEDATVVAWHVEVGQGIALNDPLCTLETAKAEVEIPSPFGGILVERGGEVGATLEVGSLLARFADVADDEVVPKPEEDPKAEPVATGGETPADHTDVLVGYGPRDAVGARGRDRVQAPPRHRRRGGPPAGTEVGPRSIAVTGVRARVAQHMARAHKEVPTAAAQREVDCSRILAMRDGWNAAAERKGEVAAVTPFSAIAWLAARVLATHGQLNSTFVPSDATTPLSPPSATIEMHEHVHLGVATATGRGLVVPVVRRAETLGMAAFSAQLRHLAEQAREGTLAPTEMVGSTATITNFGALGLDVGVPVINHPEALILGIGSIAERPVVRGAEVVARSTATIVAVFDHRVVDGAEVGAFLAELVAVVEEPATALA